MKTDREFFASALPAEDPDGSHLATIRRTPVLTGYREAQRYLREVRGLSFGRPRLLRAVADGELAYFPIDRAYCFTADDLDAFVESIRVGGAA